MARLANILLVDHAHGGTLADRLGKSGYLAEVVADAATALERATKDHPDLVLIGTPSGADALHLAREIRANPASSDIPLVLVGTEESAAYLAQALDAGIDDVISADLNDVELQARLRPLARLSVMHAELRQRARIAGKFGLTTRDRAEFSASRPALILIGDDPSGIRSSLEAIGEVQATANLFEAEEMLGRRNYDVAILSFKVPPTSLPGFCAQLRNNPRLFNLPVVVMAVPPLDTSDLYAHGASRVLPQSSDSGILGLILLGLVRRQQLRWAIRSALADSLAPSTQDPVCGVYGRAFLDAYLEDRLNTAKRLDHHLSLLVFNIPQIDGIADQFGTPAALHLRQQLAQWICGLLRAEDLTAQLDSTEFCAILPDTPPHEAEVAMHRISGVLSHTDFALHDVFQPVKVWISAGAATITDGDTPETLLFRARQEAE